MKFLLALLSFALAAHAHAQTAKLGSNDDAIRLMLYSAHPVRELLSTVNLAGATGPLLTLAEASQLADAGKKSAALERYRLALTQPGLDTRLTLWTWNGLRELGEKPSPKIAREVLGVVIEVPVKNGYDTLAAYADGTARFLNFSGTGIFWDVPDEKIKTLIQQFINASIPAAAKAQPRTTLALPKSGAQLTLLTRSGLYVIAQPPAPVINAGGALMVELVARNQAQPKR